MGVPDETERRLPAGTIGCDRVPSRVTRPAPAPPCSSLNGPVTIQTDPLPNLHVVLTPRCPEDITPTAVTRNGRKRRASRPGSRAMYLPGGKGTDLMKFRSGWLAVALWL